MPSLNSTADYIFVTLQIGLGLAGMVCFFAWAFLTLAGWADFVRWATGSKYPTPFSPKETESRKWIFRDSWRPTFKVWLATLAGAFLLIFVSIIIGALRWSEMMKN